MKKNFKITLIMVLCIMFFFIAFLYLKFKVKQKIYIEELEEINERINQLSEIKYKNDRIDKNIMLCARLLTGLICCCLVYLYISINGFSIENFNNITSIGLIIYSFTAFVFFGDINKFKDFFKRTLIFFLNKNRIDTDLELMSLLKRKEELEKLLSPIKI